MEMDFIVEHEFSVVHSLIVNGEAGSDHISHTPYRLRTVSEERKKLRRVVNLVEVSPRFLHLYCGGSMNATMNEVLTTNQ